MDKAGQGTVHKSHTDKITKIEWEGLSGWTQVAPLSSWHVLFMTVHIAAQSIPQHPK